MSRNKSKEPLPGRMDTAWPSPACDALKNNLDVESIDGGLGLRKKKSWFGSLRDAVQKSALQAKAAVDSFRSDQRGVEQRASTDGQEDGETRPRGSIGSSASMMRDDRRFAIALNPAITSLKEHLPRHSTRYKRNSVYSATSRPSCEVGDIAGPETFDLPSQRGQSPVAHQRKSSAARSLVGSIRGIGRRAKAERPTTPSDGILPGKSAENVPLPSSPIDIPVMAPALELDLGPAGFMPTNFDKPTEDIRTQNTLKLTDSENITSGLPKTHLPPRLELTFDKPATPRDILHLRIEPRNDVDLKPPSGPTTPMPGTNFSLEVDGANNEEPDNATSKVFERSVTPPDEKECKKLRTMRSLDAMAEACTIAHCHDELLEQSKTQQMQSATPAEPSPPGSKSQIKPPLYRNFASGSTEHSCPSDMEDLSRQKGAKKAGVRADSVREDDPFIDTANTTMPGVGPPSPTRSVHLPFRPKSCSSKTEGLARVTDREKGAAIDGTEHAGTDEVSITIQEAPLELHVELGSDDGTIDQDLNHTVTRLESEDNLEEEVAMHNMFYLKQSQQDVSFNDLLTKKDDNEQDSDDGLSPHLGPLVPMPPDDGVFADQSPTPETLRTRTTYIAGLGEAGYKFTLENWLKTSSNTASPATEAKTPPRRSMDISIDSVSDDERHTPQISPRSTNPDHKPSMGNRLEYELKRSERNMRYNALQQEEGADSPINDSPPVRAALRFIVGGSQDIDANAFDFADFESAYVSSRETSPQTKKLAFQAHASSQESVAKLLGTAASDYQRLHELLGSSEVDSKTRKISWDINFKGNTQRPWTRQSTPPLDAESAVRSNSPSGEKQRISSELDPATDGDIIEALFGGDGAFSVADDHAASPVGSSSREPNARPEIQEVPKQSASSGDPSPKTMQQTSKDRVASSDTLDESLAMFSSPDSGYQADKSSDSQENPVHTKTTPKRYHSQAKRRALGEVSKNAV